jgi:hypothetical protein
MWITVNCSAQSKIKYGDFTFSIEKFVSSEQFENLDSSLIEKHYVVNSYLHKRDSVMQYTAYLKESKVSTFDIVYNKELPKGLYYCREDWCVSLTSGCYRFILNL